MNRGDPMLLLEGGKKNRKLIPLFEKRKKQKRVPREKEKRQGGKTHKRKQSVEADNCRDKIFALRMREGTISKDRAPS
jgi:hypothetical protein